jgi:hypothetical protein
MKIFLLTGGLGDMLLHTPLFKSYFEKKREKMNIFLNDMYHFDLLLNNPYVNLFFCEFKCNSIPTVVKSSLSADEHVSFLKKYTSEKIKKTFIVKNYIDLMASISCDEKAAKVIAKLYKFDNVKDKGDLFLTDDEKNIGKNIVSNYSGFQIFKIKIKMVYSSIRHGVLLHNLHSFWKHRTGDNLRRAYRRAEAVPDFKERHAAISRQVPATQGWRWARPRKERCLCADVFKSELPKGERVVGRVEFVLGAGQS